MKKGLFITFEGCEGCGKSTQIRLLQEVLQEQGHSVVLTREPGGSAGAEEIRNLLLKGAQDRWDKQTELLLFYAARRDHLVKKIWPAIQENKIVLSDRFADSSMAYQCFGYGFDKEVYNFSNSLYHFIAGDFKPDITIVLNMDPVIGLNRSKNRAGNNEQRFEDMELTFHQNIQQAFLTMAKEEPERFVVVDANQSIEKVHADIWKKIKDKITC